MYMYLNKARYAIAFKSIAYLALLFSYFKSASPTSREKLHCIPCVTFSYFKSASSTNREKRGDNITPHHMPSAEYITY